MKKVEGKDLAAAVEKTNEKDPVQKSAKKTTEKKQLKKPFTFTLDEVQREYIEKLTHSYYAEHKVMINFSQALRKIIDEHAEANKK